LKTNVFTPISPYELDYIYDSKLSTVKYKQFFTTNINVDNSNWLYFGKYEDVSLYRYKNEHKNNNESSETTLIDSATPTATSTLASTPTSTTTITTTKTAANACSSMHIPYPFSGYQLQQTKNATTAPRSQSNTSLEISVTSSLMLNCSFYDSLRLWKCCTLIKQYNLKADQILNRIKNERHLWDDDYVFGETIKVLDNNTEIFKYIISFMPPHPSRKFVELR
jgi:hypothetical protein